MSRSTRLAACLFMAGIGALPLASQTPGDRSTPADSTATDRTWTIDIAQKEIVEPSFADEASLVALDEEGRWYVCAGAAVTADQVRISLTNVRADVHLRADLERLRDLFGNVTTVTGLDGEAEGDLSKDTSCEPSSGQKPENPQPN